MNGYLYVLMCIFSIEIEKLQLNRKGTHRQKDGKILAAKKSTLQHVFSQIFSYVSRSYFFTKTFYIKGAFSYFKQVLTVLFWSEW